MPHNFDRITQNPNVLAGRATIRGLRISVAHVVNLVANGLTPGQIIREPPATDRCGSSRILAFRRKLIVINEALGDRQESSLTDSACDLNPAAHRFSCR